MKYNPDSLYYHSQFLEDAKMQLIIRIFFCHVHRDALEVVSTNIDKIRMSVTEIPS